MYYKNRVDAGKKLAELLKKYSSQDVVVLALSEGSCIVAAQIAIELHSNVLLYLVKNIVLPNDNRITAAISSTGVFRFNDAFSVGEVEEIQNEYRNYIEQRRIELNHEINVIVGKDGEVKKGLLRHKTVIVVSDGLVSGFSFRMAVDFLHTININKIIAATPIATIAAVDQLHMMADELYVMGVPSNFMGVNHYYEDNLIPKTDRIFKMLLNIPLLWK
jgi:putative phosphoribosyl transferase